MKNLIKNSGVLLILIVAGIFLVQCAAKRADRDTQAWRYEIEPVSVGTQGTYLVKVWSYSSNPNIAIEQAKKNAVHGIIFRGFAGKPGVPGQRALTNNVNLENERADFFEPFFSRGGKYMKFVNVTGDGAIGSGDRIKIDNRTYKIGVVVSVNVAALRKDLEEAGIIRGLGSGF